MSEIPFPFETQASMNLSSLRSASLPLSSFVPDRIEKVRLHPSERQTHCRRVRFQ